VIPLAGFVIESLPAPSGISPAGGAWGRTALNLSNLSWANVAASVMWPPKEVFCDVVPIKAAKANKEMDKMTMAIKISINVKPDGFER
jgi:hypothetical protein